jgi:ubiquinone/menaquinone biosynthesis C-methylase UbiE
LSQIAHFHLKGFWLAFMVLNDNDKSQQPPTGESYPSSLLEKIKLITANLSGCQRVLDIGSGPGYFTGPLSHRRGIILAVGLDESWYRLEEFRITNFDLPAVMARAENIPFLDRSFDGLVASMVLHEIIQFDGESTLEMTLGEIARVLSLGGRALILDHLRPPQGNSILRMSREAREKLKFFAHAFKPREVYYKLIPPDMVEMKNEDIADFACKTAFFGTESEEEELQLSRSIFEKDSFVSSCVSKGLALVKWQAFNSIAQELSRNEITMEGGEPWEGDFLAVFQKKVI